MMYISVIKYNKKEKILYNIKNNQEHKCIKCSSSKIYVQIWWNEVYLQLLSFLLFLFIYACYFLYLTARRVPNNNCYVIK